MDFSWSMILSSFWILNELDFIVLNGFLIEHDLFRDVDSRKQWFYHFNWILLRHEIFDGTWILLDDEFIKGLWILHQRWIFQWPWISHLSWFYQQTWILVDIDFIYDQWILSLLEFIWLDGFSASMMSYRTYWISQVAWVIRVHWIFSFKGQFGSSM